jgi:hypothetical protein
MPAEATSSCRSNRPWDAPQSVREDIIPDIVWPSSAESDFRKEGAAESRKRAASGIMARKLVWA